MKGNRRAVVAIALIGLSVVMIAGCGGSKVTKENFDKIKTGMTEAEVEAILGKATDSGGASASLPGMSVSGTMKVWKDGDKKIMVTFSDGKVAGIPIATGL